MQEEEEGEEEEEEEGDGGKGDHGHNLTRTPDLVCTLGNRVNTILIQKRWDGWWGVQLKINDKVVCSVYTESGTVDLERFKV